MAERADTVGSWTRWAPVALIVLAFVSPGAWLITRLPPVPVAKALQLGTAALWLLAFGLGLVLWARPDRRIVRGLGAVLVTVAVSYLVGGHLFAVAFYDLFANMPLVQWLAFPTVFVLAAGMIAGRDALMRSLELVMGFGTLLALVMAYQQVTTNANWVFGTTAYSITALVPLIPIGVGLALASSGVSRWLWAAAAVIVTGALGVFSASIMGAVAAVFAVLITVALWPAPPASGLPRPARIVAGVLAALMVAGMLFAQIPALSARWVHPEASDSPSLVSRVYLWQGAQDMVAERPVFGFGPSGYRVAAVEYLDPELLQFGPDVQGSIDPTVYSPQSPHSVLWEILTRLGIVGLAALLALLAAWGTVLVERLRSDDLLAGLRAALGAAFLAALFAMLTNPVLFPIGLFAPVVAGLAIAPLSAGLSAPPGDTSSRLRPAFGLLGAAVLLVAAWLLVGEWRGYTAPTDDPYRAISAHEATLRVLPGHPTATRRLLETRILVAGEDGEARLVQAVVSAAPGYIHDYAPNLVSITAYSLAQAERTGRTDLDWERSLLSRAADVLPPIPSLVAEQLRLSVLSGDADAVREAIPDAERWGGPYPFTESYLEQAEELMRRAE